MLFRFISTLRTLRRQILAVLHRSHMHKNPVIDKLQLVKGATSDVNLQPTAFILLQKRRLSLIHQLHCEYLAAVERLHLIDAVVDFVEHVDFDSWSYLEFKALSEFLARLLAADFDKRDIVIHTLAVHILRPLRTYPADNVDRLNSPALLAAFCIGRHILESHPKACLSLVASSFCNCIKVLKLCVVAPAKPEIVAECLLLAGVLLQSPPKYINVYEREAFRACLIALHKSSYAITTELAKAHWALVESLPSVGKKEVKEILHLLDTEKSALLVTDLEQPFTLPVRKCLTLGMQMGSPKISVFNENLKRIFKYTKIDHALIAAAVASILDDLALDHAYVSKAILTILSVTNQTFSAAALERLVRDCGRSCRIAANFRDFALALLSIVRINLPLILAHYSAAICRGLRQCSVIFPECLTAHDFQNFLPLSLPSFSLQAASVDLIVSAMRLRPTVLVNQATFLFAQLKGDVQSCQDKDCRVDGNSVFGLLKLFSGICNALFKQYPEYVDKLLAKQIAQFAISSLAVSNEKWLKIGSMLIAQALIVNNQCSEDLISCITAHIKSLPPDLAIHCFDSAATLKGLDITDALKYLASLSNRIIAEFDQTITIAHVMRQVSIGSNEDACNLFGRMIAFVPVEFDPDCFAKIFWNASRDLQEVILVSWNSSIQQFSSKISINIANAVISLLKFPHIRLKSDAHRGMILELVQSLAVAATVNQDFIVRIKAGLILGAIFFIVLPESVSDLSDQIAVAALSNPSISLARPSYIVGLGALHGVNHAVDAMTAVGLLSSVAREGLANSADEVSAAAFYAMESLVLGRIDQFSNFHFYQEIVLLVYEIVLRNQISIRLGAAIQAALTSMLGIFSRAESATFSSLVDEIRIIFDYCRWDQLFSTSLCSLITWNHLESNLSTNILFWLPQTPTPTLNLINSMLFFAEYKAFTDADFNFLSLGLVHTLSACSSSVFGSAIDSITERLNFYHANLAHSESIMTVDSSLSATTTPSLFRIKKTPAIAIVLQALASTSVRLRSLQQDKMKKALELIVMLCTWAIMDSKHSRNLVIGALQLLNNTIVHLYSITDDLCVGNSVLEVFDSQLISLINTAIIEGLATETSDRSFSILGYAAFFSLLKAKVQFSKNVLKESTKYTALIEGSYEVLAAEMECLQLKIEDPLAERLADTIVEGLCLAQQEGIPVFEQKGFDPAVFSTLTGQTINNLGSSEKVLLLIKTISQLHCEPALLQDIIVRLSKSSMLYALKSAIILAEHGQPVNLSKGLLILPWQAVSIPVIELTGQLGYLEPIEQWSEMYLTHSSADYAIGTALCSQLLKLSLNFELPFRILSTLTMDPSASSDPERCKQLLQLLKQAIQSTVDSSQLKNAVDVIDGLLKGCFDSKLPKSRRAYLLQLGCFGICTRSVIATTEHFRLISQAFATLCDDFEALQLLLESWILLLKSLTKPSTAVNIEFVHFVEALTLDQIQSMFSQRDTTCESPELVDHLWKQTLRAADMFGQKLQQHPSIATFTAVSIAKLGLSES